MGFFEFLIAAIVILAPFIFVLALVKVLARRKDSDRLGLDEAQLMQELHQGLSRMERRVENLETLMMKETRDETREERLEREFRNLEK